MSSTEPPFRQKLLTQDGSISRPWWMWFNSVYNTIGDSLSVIIGIFETESGRIKKITYKSADYTLTASDNVVYFDTDGGDITATLPTIVQGTEYRISNTGSSGNKVTLTSSENIYGSSDDLLIYDLEDFEINGDVTNLQGWR